MNRSAATRQGALEGGLQVAIGWLLVTAVTLTVLVGCTSEPTATDPPGERGAMAGPSGSSTPSTDGTVTVDEWAQGFCRGFTRWLEQVSAAGEALPSMIVPGDLPGARDAIAQLFDDVATGTEEFTKTLEGGDPPAISRGDEFESALVSRFEQFGRAMSSASDAAGAVATSDPVEFQNKVTELVATFQSEIATVSTSFAEIDDQFPDRRLAAAVSKECSFG